jgi:hypothetical protein
LPIIGHNAFGNGFGCGQRAENVLEDAEGREDLEERGGVDEGRRDTGVDEEDSSGVHSGWPDILRASVGGNVDCDKFSSARDKGKMRVLGETKADKPVIHDFPTTLHLHFHQTMHLT